MGTDLSLSPDETADARDRLKVCPQLSNLKIKCKTYPEVSSLTGKAYFLFIILIK
jgi:hypothetical protein